jgi:poly(A) polymerase
MAASGTLGAILPGASSLAIPILVHVEEGAMLAPDPIRRLAALGGEGSDELRLSKAQISQLARLRRGIEDGMGAAELGYCYGATEAVDILAVRAALLGCDLPPVATKDAWFGAGQKCPVRAADLMPEVQGEALGKRLREIEARWIASGFALSKADLLG